MNRLQKKCLIATVGFHLLLVLTLLFGSAFFNRRADTPDDTQVLEVIPPTILEAALNSGVKNAPAPAPQPTPAPQVKIVQPPAPLPKPQPQPQPQPAPEPPPPKPVATPPTPTPKPEPARQPTPEPKVAQSPEPAPKPAPKPTPKPHEIKVNLNQVTRNAPSVAEARAAAAARAQERQRQARLKAIAAAATAIEKNASSSTEVEMPGDGSVSFANYASVVRTVYERAWIPPNDTASDDANIKVRVTINSDGKVTASRILDRSGDSRVDASVQRTLDRVDFVAPFPPGAKEKEKTFIINFNLKAKRMLG